jgi:hypothetical protein
MQACLIVAHKRSSSLEYEKQFQLISPDTTTPAREAPALMVLW